MEEVTLKIYITCNGCQRRSLEAAKLSAYFIANKCEIVKKAKNADKIVFVSCALDRFHEKESFALIKKFEGYGKDFYLLGCLTEIIPHKFRNKFNSNFRGKILPTSIINEIDKFFPEFKTPFSKIPEAHKLFSNFNLFSRAFRNFNLSSILKLITSPVLVKEKYRSINTINKLEKSEAAYLCISSGCPNSCSYCAKTRAFGTLKSKHVDDCLAEYLELIKSGYDRIALTADDTGSYGLDTGISLPYLLDKLAKTKSGKRINWVIKNFHPKWIIKYQKELKPYISSGLISEIVCPIESGSNRILKLMNRNYINEELVSVLNEFKILNPDLILRTHVMIGFPGETEDDFELTLKAIKDCGFNWVTFFRYYDAENTPSEIMEGKLSDDTIRKRIKKMKKYMYKNNIPWL